MSENKKHPLVVFSGGLDSTYLLYMQLKETDVHTCYVHGSQHPTKAQEELRRRPEIIRTLEEMTGHRVLSDTIIKHGFMEAVENHFSLHGGSREEFRKGRWPDHTWGQAAMWLYGILYVFNGHKHSIVLMGSVLGDDINVHLKTMQELWANLCVIAKSQPADLSFPLYLTSKQTILHELPRSLLPLIWTCELPEYDVLDRVRPCGSCEACETAFAEINRYERRMGQSLQSMASFVDHAMEDYLKNRRKAIENEEAIGEVLPKEPIASDSCK